MLVYSPQTGQIYSGYRIQQQQFNPNQQQMYNGFNQEGYGGAPGSGSNNNAYEIYGANGNAAGENMAGYLSDSFIDSINQKATTWTVSLIFF